MKSRILSLLIGLFFIHFSINGQNLENESKSYNFIIEGKGSFSTIQLTEEELHLSSAHVSSVSGVSHFYFQQRWNDIDIFNAVGSVHIDNEGVVRHTTNNFINPDNYSAQNQRNYGVEAAITSAADHFDLPIVSTTELLSEEPGGNQKRVFSNPNYSRTEILTQYVYLPHNGRLVLAHSIVLDIAQIHEKWMVFVEAGSNQVIRKEPLFLECNFGSPEECEPVQHLHESNRPSNDLTHASLGEMMNNSYNVFAIPLEAPNEGSRSIVTEPWLDAPAASPFGWHDTDGIAGAEFTVTNGNNVLAVDDLDGDNIGGTSPDGGANLMFDFPLDLAMDPITYIDAAIVNLFYMNNIVHDVAYLYGFDAASGNFQENNYGNGGTGSDAVRAEAQDGSDTNNARFFSAPEGFSPRMEMYEWVPTIGSATIEVTAPPNISGFYTSAKAAFGPQVASITGDLVLAGGNIACDTMPITNGGAINGNIALIDRGGCSFVEKVLNAQDEGAIAVIVCNNLPGAGVFSMGGNDGSITIPSAMLSFEDCETIKVELGNTVTVNLELIDQVNTDSDLDNGIIAHEYGHGISIRLTGGPTNIGCLSGDEQMGEGWSDYFGLMLQLKPGDMGEDRNGIGTYVEGDVPTGNGIRPFPYSTDFNVNPMTYHTISLQNISVPHGVGSVWCTMLWDMTWNLIEKHGYEPDVYATTGGNGIAMELVMEGLKLQGCFPGFVTGRDAILRADTLLNGAANSCEIWRAFARRGLGVGADQGSVGSRTDGVQSFLLPPGCPDELLQPCTDEVLVYSNETIPDGTDKRVNTTIDIDESDVLAGTIVSLRADQAINIEPLFEVEATGELFMKAIPCIDMPRNNIIENRSIQTEHQER